MLLLGPLGFAAPWVLSALIALPVLWVMLRAMPPAPRRVVFPGVALLAGLVDRHPQARRTPWWLLLLRLAAVAALIIAFAGPVWRPVAQAPATGPLLVVMDAGYAAGNDWPARQARAERALSDAAAAGRPAALMLADGRGGAVTFQTGDALLPALRGAQPVAWGSALPDAVELPDGPITTLWLADGTDYPGRAAWLSALTARGAVTVAPPLRALQTLMLEPGDTPALRVNGAAQIAAIGPDPQGTSRELARLDGDDLIQISLPPELRNRIARFQIIGQDHAGAVVLADDRVRRRKVALVGDPGAEGQELLSQTHYLRQALTPIADVVEGGLSDLLNTAPDVIILADQVGLSDPDRLVEWVGQGGLLIRFAGPRMAGYDDLTGEPLLPVPLRQGGRDIGGALSWGAPRGLAPFAADGVFAGLTAPDDVAVRAQLMAQPSPVLGDFTIAALSDNTPLVTRDRLGQGQVVLFHVTANAEWSNLPLSGLFVDMLARLIATARLSPVAETGMQDQPFWTPETVLNGFGRAVDPVGLSPVAADDLARGPGVDRPAGIYAAGERRVALHAGAAFRPAEWPGAVIQADDPGRDLRGVLLVAAALLLALDAVGSVLVRGLVVALLLALPAAPRAMAQDLSPDLIRAADEVALAYVITGDADVDAASHSGLRGLSQALHARTSVEPGRPVGVDLNRDDLSVLTFLYWPVTDTQPLPDPQAYLRLNAFLRSGGMILFDTRDGDLAGVGGPDRSGALQMLAAPLDIPPLAPVPDDHVLTRTFYLLDDFPGRWQGNPIWAEAPAASDQTAAGFRHLNDGVTPVIIGGNAWAEAWGVTDHGRFTHPVGRGWDGDHQRELAYRFGINLIMYVLTGNYKSDQVHVPALLERLATEGGQ
ncbi:DUF4159 domain-containing protein [Paracoccus sp. (in: a-proteobacteria)]|uniref:DUF4159 domain-containing protein n=1 Tax=Paracoccus sp. TaxID=267 RepID=UPI0026DEB4C3|nr:DUF4159 domain-containing protein [Paracoccus sp. (in: a-proteobacteria)]MDO5647401.1 DUF4159 domain-containing protein [Paracoccus sp. (in: a-proteobacteria)]